jgi:nitrogen fixation protein NifU and related proteins
LYSETVRRLVAELPNHGKLPEATHSGRLENPVCGDVACLFLQVEQGRVSACRFQAQGCPGAIAAAAAVTLLATGKRVEDCLSITTDSVLSFLGGLPAHRVHGAELAIEVLRKALNGA